MEQWESVTSEDCIARYGWHEASHYLTILLRNRKIKVLIVHVTVLVERPQTTGDSTRSPPITTNATRYYCPSTNTLHSHNLESCYHKHAHQRTATTHYWPSPAVPEMRLTDRTASIFTSSIDALIVITDTQNGILLLCKGSTVERLQTAPNWRLGRALG